MKTNTQKRLSFYRFAMSLSMGLIWASLFFWITDTHAIGTLERMHCDYIFSEYAFTQIDRADYPRCESRFDYLTKRYLNNNYFLWAK